MKTWKKIVVAAAVWTVSASAVMAQEVTLRLHHFLPPQATISAKLLVPWAQEIEAKSKGRIKVQVFPSMQMGGSPAQLYDQARDGVVDVSFAVMGYMPGRFVKTEVFELPFLAGTSAEQSSRAFWDFVNQQALDEFRETKVLAAFTQGPGLLHSKEPITGIDSIRGMKIRGGTRMISKMLTTLGAISVPVPLPGTPEALSKGVVQATTLPWEVTPALKVLDLAPHHTEFSGDKGLYTASVALVMNKAKYASLPEDLRKVIDDNSGAVLSIKGGQVMDEGDRVARQAAVAKGNTVIRLNAEQTERWRKAAEPVQMEWVNDMKAKGIDGARLIKDVEASLRKYAQ